MASVEQLQREFPERKIQLVVCPKILGANVKVSNLEQMVAVSRYEHLIVNDSDIRVERDYLRRVIAPLGGRACRNGDVSVSWSCRAHSRIAIGSRSASALISVRESWWRGNWKADLHFGLGSTLAFRRAELERIGGFKSIVDFLADDYELGRRIAALGLEVVLSERVVETHLPAYDLRGFLAHQLRWARGVRDARARRLHRTGFHLWIDVGAVERGLPAGAAPWSWWCLAVMLLLRIAVAFVVGRSVLEDRRRRRRVWLLPLRDLIAVGVWIASFAGHTVTWRGDRFRLKNGRLTRI